MKHIARKRFGQHFLTDQGLIDSILDLVGPQAGECLVEIGPGLGALTHGLIERVNRLTVIELDRDLAGRWRDHLGVEVIEMDVLKVDFSQIYPVQDAMGKSPANDPKNDSLRPALRLIGNLPYNISTPILFHLMQYAPIIHDQHFMLQKEVVDRMVGKPCTADYGRLSVMLQWRYDMERLIGVPPEAFDPPPRVNSALVRMIPRKQPAALSFECLQELVQVAFSQRRKLLRHTLGHWLEAKRFGGEFDLQRRAEEVPVAQYIALAQLI